MTDPKENGRHVVEDEEGFVDKEVKKRILENRQEVDEWSRSLFSAERTGGIDTEDAVMIWRDRVVEYLTSIEPLLRDDSLPDARHAYLREPLGVAVLEPPEEYQQEPGRPSIEELVERGPEWFRGDPPEPKQQTFQGLKSVIETERVTAEWEVPVDTDRPPRREREQVHKQQPVPKHVLENAVRVADEFLHQIGIGVTTVEDANDEWEV